MERDLEEIEMMDNVLNLYFKRFRFGDGYYTDSIGQELNITKKRYQYYINEIVRFSRNEKTMCNNLMETWRDGDENLRCNESTAVFIEKSGFAGYYKIKKPMEISGKEPAKRLLTIEDKDKLLECLINACIIGQEYYVTPFQPILDETKLTAQELHTLFTQFNTKGLIDYNGHIHWLNKVVDFTVHQTAVDFYSNGGFQGEKERQTQMRTPNVTTTIHARDIINSPINSPDSPRTISKVEGNNNTLIQSSEDSKSSLSQKNAKPKKIKIIAIIGLIVTIIGVILAYLEYIKKP